ncbi:Mu transposase C-terminal domain-containing protein [Streptomyces sp. NPDC023723]|uniref:Mu transposase C-terminal domain-containing protein n=1 Tax=Streptomyces sp. NPDC023723 TaxID=3154323 RepID=UPI0033C46F7E
MFRTIGDRFSQYVAGYTGSDVTQRGSHVEDEACWTLSQVQDLLEEWLVADWQHRRHASLRHPLAPKLAVSPNEMGAALVGVSGYVPVLLSEDDYVELMPVKRVGINDYGIRFDYRTYDHEVLNPHRGRRSTAPDGMWEVHHNPYDPQQIWVRLPGGWEDVPWIHKGRVSLPSPTSPGGTSARPSSAAATAMSGLAARSSKFLSTPTRTDSATSKNSLKRLDTT